jgi:SAM-dependent methyltransferase
VNLFLRGMVRAVAEAFSLPCPVLEIGSYQVPGQQDLADLRALFPGRSYVGLDTRPGLGVDLIADVEHLPHADASVGTVLALSTFEHVPHFWRGFAEVRRVLRPDGAFLVASPFYFHLHGHPHDFWRFSPQALELLLDEYPSKIIGWQGLESRPANVWALAFGEQRPPIAPAEYCRYQSLMHRYARMPLPWRRRLRYQVGRMFFGHTLFAPYLYRDTWQTRCLNRRGPARRQGASPRSAAPASVPAAPDVR